MSKSTYSKQYQTVIERLIQARKEAKLTQTKVAVTLGKPQSYLSKIERGERRVDVAELKLIADIYKKPLAYFVEK